MGRFVDFDRSEREIPFGAMNEFPDEALADRQYFRRNPEVVDEVAVTGVIEAVLHQIHDERVRAGCIKAGKVRPRRLWAECYLLRTLRELRPRHIAEACNLTPKYVSDVIPKGKAIARELGFSGLLEIILRSTSLH